MKHLIIETMLIIAVIFLILTNLGLHNTIQESQQTLIKWQEEVGRLQAKFHKLEIISSTPEYLLTLQEQLDICQQKNSLEDSF